MTNCLACCDTNNKANNEVSFRATLLSILCNALSNSSGEITPLGQTSTIPYGADYKINTYTGDNITQTVYKVGGAGGTIVATETNTYDGAKLLTTTVVRL